MSKLNPQPDASSTINWADPDAAVRIVTAASKREKGITILVDEKFQVLAWKSVLSSPTDTIDLKKAADILEKAAGPGAPGGQAAGQVGAPDPKLMVIVALTGLFAYLIRKNYVIRAAATGNGWTFNLDLTPSSSSAR